MKLIEACRRHAVCNWQNKFDWLRSWSELHRCNDATILIIFEMANGRSGTFCTYVMDRIRWQMMDNVHMLTIRLSYLANTASHPKYPDNICLNERRRRRRRDGEWKTLNWCQKLMSHVWVEQQSCNSCEDDANRKKSKTISPMITQELNNTSTFTPPAHCSCIKSYYTFHLRIYLYNSNRVPKFYLWCLTANLRIGKSVTYEIKRMRLVVCWFSPVINQCFSRTKTENNRSTRRLFAYVRLFLFGHRRLSNFIEMKGQEKLTSAREKQREWEGG